MNQIQTTTNIPELTLEHFNRYSTHEIMGICELNKVGDIENGIKIFWDVIVENSSSDKPAIVAQWITLKYR